MKKDVETDIYKIAHSCENGGDHECVEHPDCGVSLTAQETGRLWRALETLGGDQLRVVVEGYPMVTYNAARQAVQITSSCGTTVGHLPVGSRQARALSTNE